LGGMERRGQDGAYYRTINKAVLRPINRMKSGARKKNRGGDQTTVIK